MSIKVSSNRPTSRSNHEIQSISIRNNRKLTREAMSITRDDQPPNKRKTQSNKVKEEPIDSEIQSVAFINEQTSIINQA